MTRSNVKFYLDDFWFSERLNEDVSVKAEAYADYWYDHGDRETPPDGGFDITSLEVEFHRFDENEIEIPIDEKLKELLKEDFIEWLNDHEELFHEC